MLVQVYVDFLRHYFPLFPDVSLPVRARKWDGSAEDGLFDGKSDRCTGRKKANVEIEGESSGAGIYGSLV